MSTIDIVSDELVGAQEVAVAFCVGDFARTQLFILSGAGLKVGWSICPV